MHVGIANISSSHASSPQKILQKQSILFSILNFLLCYVYIHMPGYMCLHHIYARDFQSQKRTSDSLEGVADGCELPMWVAGIKLLSSAKALSALNCRATSLVPTLAFSTK